MSNTLPKSETEVRVEGDICAFYFTVSSADETSDAKLYAQHQESYRELWTEVDMLAKKHLGPNAELKTFLLDRGSIEITLIFKAFEFLSKIKAFKESIALLFSAAQSLFETFAASHSQSPVDIKGSWTPGPALSSEAPADNSRWRLVSLWRRYLALEVGYSTVGLLLAQLAFTAVSGVTTYRGFLLMMDSWLLASIAAFGIQSLVFWLPRRFNHKKPGRLLIDITSFIFSVVISIIFSYQAFVDILVPQETRDNRNTSELFMEVQPTINDIVTVVNGAVSEVSNKLKEYEDKAQRELSEGGTKGKPSVPGKGPIYEEWENLKGVEQARLQTLTSIQNQANIHVAQIRDLEQGPGEPQKKRSDLKYHINQLLILANDPQVQNVVLESKSNLPAIAQGLRPPEIAVGGQSAGAAGVKENFMKGLTIAQVAIKDVFARKELDSFHAGAFVALIVAAALDMLILVAGVVSSIQRVPMQYRRFVPALLANRHIKFVRREGKLGLRIVRDHKGEATQLSSSQDVAAQVLIQNGYLKLTEETENASANRRSEVLLIEGNILPFFYDDGSVQ